MKRRIPVLMLLAAVIAAGVYLYPRLTKKAKPENQLTLSGNIEAHESLVSFKVQGRIIDLPIEEGQSVERGTLLARLEDADSKQTVRIDEANVHVRESNLALTLAGTREQELKASQQTMFDAQADLQQKKLDDDRAQRLFEQVLRTSTLTETQLHYAEFLAETGHRDLAKQQALRIRDKRAQMPGFQRRRERKLFRRNSALLRKL